MPSTCKDMLIACPAFNLDGETHQFPPVLLQRSAPNWWASKGAATERVDSGGDHANNVNDINAVLAVGNSSLQVLKTQADFFSTAVPIFNLGVQALKWGTQTYQEISQGCSEKEFKFCDRPASAPDTVSSWPAFMPQNIGLDILIYVELVAGRIQTAQWEEYLQKASEVTCLKSAMRRIQVSCNFAQSRSMNKAKSAGFGKSLDDVHEDDFHCGLKMKQIVAGQGALGLCKASDYLTPSICQKKKFVHNGQDVLFSSIRNCGICNGRLEAPTPWEIPDSEVQLTDCESDALSKELEAIYKRTSQWDDDIFNAEDGLKYTVYTDGPPEAQVNKITEKWAEVESWITSTNNEHLESLHGCMRMNSLEEEVDGGYFTNCFRKMCNIPKRAEIVASDGVDESNWFHKAHTVGAFSVKTSALFKGLTFCWRTKIVGFVLMHGRTRA
jgi:hypothetical protein